MKNKLKSSNPQKKKLPSVLSKMKSIQEVHDYYQKIISCMPNNVYWLDRNCVTQGCNDNVLRFIGLNQLDEFVGINYEQMGEIAGWEKGHWKKYKQDDLAVMSSGVAKLNIEDPPIYDEQGKPTYYLSSRVPIYDSEHKEVIGIIGISVDITQQKLVEESFRSAKNAAEAANNAKTEFIANISHDIRTPLTGVIGLSELLEHDLSNQADKEKAHMLHDSGEQLLNMLNEILDDVRADNLTEKDVKTESFDLYRCIEDLISLETPAISLKHLELVTQIALDVPRFICSDRSKIHRILLNLIGNAIKFTQSGHISLDVQCLHRDKHEAHLTFSVSDTGIGIPEEAQAQVFSRFFKATSSYKGLYEGHGLGLHIARSYVELLGGHITLTSTVGVGTIFHFDIVCGLVEPDSDLKQTAPSSSTFKPSKEQSLHLLLVEDNLVALKTLEFLLKQKGYTFSSAMSGEDALNLLQNEKFDVMITDIGLPDISGIKLSQRIRNQEKVLNKPPLPIIGLTGHAKETILDKTMPHGMNEVFSKPASLDILHGCIQKLTQKQEDSNTNITHISSSKVSLGVDLPDTEEELFKLDAFPLFDEESALNQIGDRQLLIKLINDYLSDDMQKDFLLMQDLYQQEKWGEVEKIAHKIKGGVSYLGAEKMRYACQYLERYYKAGHRQLLEPLYQQLLHVNEDTNAILRQWLTEHLNRY